MNSFRTAGVTPMGPRKHEPGPPMMLGNMREKL